jgi:hypothetical protein
MPTITASTCCTAKARATSAKMSAALKALSRTKAGRAQIQKNAKALHTAKLAREAKKARARKAVPVNVTPNPNYKIPPAHLPKPKAKPPCNCGKKK